MIKIITFLSLFITQTAFAGNYVDITASDVATTTSYIGKLFNDLDVFIFILIGIPLGFWVIHKLIMTLFSPTKPL